MEINDDFGMMTHNAESARKTMEKILRCLERCEKRHGPENVIFGLQSAVFNYFNKADIDGETPDAFNAAMFDCWCADIRRELHDSIKRSVTH